MVEEEESQIKEINTDAERWRRLHVCVSEFREEHNMSVLNFIIFSGLEDTFYNRQLLSAHGSKFCPFCSENTKGLLVFSKLLDLFHKITLKKISHKQYLFLKSMKYIKIT